MLDKARFGHGDPDPIRQGVHPSVEDWIRARLDSQGCFQPRRDDERHQPPLSDAI